jgi:arrestin-related trafficking adapter 4/5/7
MTPTPRTNGAVRTKPTLEIIPDTRFIVFHGGEHEAQSVTLTGVVRLTTPESISIAKPKIRLEGKRKISWWYMGGLSAGEVTDKRSFWTQEQKLGVESAHKIKAGVIEWPFEFELSPSMPESVEGLRETFIAYHLYASVSRPGWNTKDLLAQEHIRIVRTLGADSMEMTRSRVNADIWANKISYSISIPTDAIVFGTSITADVELSPIKKGLKLGKVELKLLETVVKRIQLSELPDARGDRSKTEESEVATMDMEFPEHSRIMYDDETIENPMMADEMYKFKATLPLPRSLNTCRQDVDSHQINVTHRFKLMVNIHNPEGHISQLVCRLPVKLFISPNLPVDESNEVCAIANGVTHEELNNTETAVVAPPEYGRHQLDQLFSDMDPAGYMSRAPSDHGSPSGPEAQSRRGSEDYTGPSLNGVINGIANGDHEDEEHGSASPSVLHSRLTDLQERESSFTRRSPAVSFSYSPAGGNSPAPGMVGSSHSQPGGYFPSNLRESPRNGSAAGSRRPSDGEDSAPVRQHDYNMDNLMRVPSYGAALRTSGTITPHTDAPPSYVEATSRPPSPQGPQRPSQAHVRTGIESPNSQARQQPARTSTGDMLAAFDTTPHPPAMARPPRSRRASNTADDAARLRMLRVGT